LEFIHEVPVAVPAAAHAVIADFADVGALPKIFSHIRATAAGDADDLARMIIILDGHHLEFAAQRTSASNDEVCWQSLVDDLYYVLCITARPKSSEHCAVQVCISYDPPGFINDICETFGRKHAFRRKLEDDLRRYAQSFAVAPAVHAIPVTA